mmetsp:Transcript_23752/g.35674  ORF Transcript_23752/g.35674 Transcript_23752/m.35674 type:complete len:1124 (-) Transcript_23752:221-3592(-)
MLPPVPKVHVSHDRKFSSAACEELPALDPSLDFEQNLVLFPHRHLKNVRNCRPIQYHRSFLARAEGCHFSHHEGDPLVRLSSPRFDFQTCLILLHKWKTFQIVEEIVILLEQYFDLSCIHRMNENANLQTLPLRFAGLKKQTPSLCLFLGAPSPHSHHGSNETTNPIKSNFLTRLSVAMIPSPIAMGGKIAVSFNTEALDAVLANLTKTIQLHEQKISRITALEDSQELLEKEFQSIRTNATTSRCDVAGTFTEDAGTCSSLSSQTTSEENLAYNNDPGNMRVAPPSGLLQMKRDVTKLKVLILDLKQIQSCSAASSKVAHSQIGQLKSEILDIQRDIASAASTEHIQSLYQQFSQHQINSEAIFVKFKDELVLDTIERGKKDSLQLKKLLKEHEDIAALKYDSLESKLSLYARQNEVQSLEADVEFRSSGFESRIENLVNSLKDLTKSVHMTNERHGLATIRRLRCICVQRQLRASWSKWNECLVHLKEAKMRSHVKKCVIRKLMVRNGRNAKDRSFMVWVKHMQYERRKVKSIRRLNQLIHDRFAGNCRDVFRKWRRCIIFGKEMQLCSDDRTLGHNKTPMDIPSTKHNENDNIRYVTDLDEKGDNDKAESGDERKQIKSKQEDQVYQPPDSLEESSSEGNIFSQASQKAIDIEEQNNHLKMVMAELRNDTEGCLDMLVHELNRLRNDEIHSLQMGLSDTKKSFNKDLRSKIKGTIEDFNAKFDDLEMRINSRVQLINDEIPKITSTVTHHAKEIEEIKGRMQRVKHDHDAKINALLDQKEDMEDKVQGLERNLLEANKRIISLVEDQVTSKARIQTLTERLGKSERETSETKVALQDTAQHFQREITSMKLSITENAEKSAALQNSIDTTTDELTTTRIETRKTFDRVYARLNAPGVRKPPLDIVVNDCILYEKVVADKKYVFPLNSIIKEESDSDVPEDIANFAHDYAEWIAYKADHDALQRVIVGVTPEEMVFIDEDTDTRRRELLEQLRIDFSCKIDTIHEKPGMSRLEARNKFIGRVMDAIDSALSKHDQVLVSNSTRVGRVKPSLPTCVACDRPLRNKARRTTEGKKEGGGDQGASTNNKKQSILGKFQPNNENFEIENYKLTFFPDHIRCLLIQ